MSEILDIAAALSRLLKAENVLLICHKNPDGDTIGSAAALYWALKGLGKTVAVLCATPSQPCTTICPSRCLTAALALRSSWRWMWPVSSCLASATTSGITLSTSICASTTTAPTAAMPMRRWWTTTRLPPPSC